MVWIMAIIMLMPAKQSASSAQDLGSSHSALKVDGSPVEVSDAPSPESQASAANKLPVVIPTPTALVAVVLLLLPFALSTLRILRRKRSA